MESDVLQLPLSHRLLVWFEGNKKLVGWGVAVVVGLGIVYGFVVWQKGAREVNAGEALTAASVPTPGSDGLRTDLSQAFLKVANQYSGTAAGNWAVLLAANALFDQGKFTEARPVYTRFAQEHRDSPFVGQALLGIGACYEALGQTNEAVNQYKDIVDHHSSDMVLPQAQFSLACLYEAQGKLELARDYYEKASRSMYNSITSEAGIRYEELIQRNPSLAPKPIVAPNAPAPSLTKP